MMEHPRAEATIVLEHPQANDARALQVQEEISALDISLAALSDVAEVVERRLHDAGVTREPEVESQDVHALPTKQETVPEAPLVPLAARIRGLRARVDEIGARLTHLSYSLEI